MDAFDDLLRLARRLRVGAGEHLQPVRWRPAADVYRTPGGWLVKLELAGVRPEEVEVRTAGNLLAIRGRRCDSALVEGGSHYSLEIAYDRFERRLELPCDLDRCRIATEYRDGMLLVRIEVGN